MSTDKLHRETSARWRLGALALAVLLLPACQTARMPIPDTLATSERMPVSGRQGLQVNQSLRFGPFEAHGVRRSWTRGRDRGATTVATQHERRQEYRFTLREAGEDHWFVACHAAALTVSIDILSVDFRPTDESAVYCNLQLLSDPSTSWTLDLRETRDRPLSGTLSGGGERLAVSGTNRVDRALAMDATTGYEFRDADGVIGAVEVLNRGAVWLSGDLGAERRRTLAAASAALLLLEDLRSTYRD
jgi:hypothetical protein